MASPVHGIAGWFDALAYGHWWSLVSCVMILIVAVWISRQNEQQHEPPTIPEKIPFVSNTYQYITNNSAFLKRARFNLGNVPVYLVSGPQYIQTLLRSSSSLSSDKFILMVDENIHNMAPGDIARLTRDRSGRHGRRPNPGYEEYPDKERLWAGLHNLFIETIAQKDAADQLASSFSRFWKRKLDAFPTGERREVRVFDWLKRDMAEATIASVMGTLLLEMHPEILDGLWEFVDIALSLLYAPSPSSSPALVRWIWRKINPRPYHVRQRVHGIMGDYLREAFERFDREGPDANADWEPVFGSRSHREQAMFYKERGFERGTRVGTSFGFLFGANSNTIPMAAWAMMYIFRDPTLLRAVREEVSTAALAEGGKLDVQKVLALPLLQSVYVETLRLHVALNVTREVVSEGMVLNAEYKLPKGALLQAPTSIAQKDETVWARDGHGASEFWAERHVTYNELGQRGFSMMGRPSDFFPYGGGISVCPGRHFAKQEIMLSIAMLVSRFDIEFIDWTMPDGSPSDRAAEGDAKFCGAAAMPPDRDAKISMRRRM